MAEKEGKAYFCDATVAAFPGDSPSPLLRCDKKKGHGGVYHYETWVGRWKRDGTDLMWYNDDKKRYCDPPPGSN